MDRTGQTCGTAPPTSSIRFCVVRRRSSTALGGTLWKAWKAGTPAVELGARLAVLRVAVYHSRACGDGSSITSVRQPRAWRRLAEVPELDTAGR